MANPTALSHTTPLSRDTVGDMLDFIAHEVGIQKGELGTTERSVLLGYLNKELEQWRQLGAHGMGEFSVDHTWVSGDDTFELPADWAGLKGHFIYQLDSDGNPYSKVPLVDQNHFYDSHVEGESLYDDGETPVAIVYQESTNRRRIMRIFPRPDAGTVFRIFYRAYAETLVNNGDVIEAPPAAMDGIMWGAIERGLFSRGAGDRMQYARIKKAEARASLTGQGKEIKRPMRARRFSERAMGGYEATSPERPS